jgi:hypothetical protein
MKTIQFIQNHWQWFVAAVPIIGRAYYAIVNKGGIVGIWRALVFGTNTPKQPVDTEPPYPEPGQNPKHISLQ